ncbi:DUF1223 domain-containing protein [Edaphobacter bradus]|uniref:DUF1223 domain-containing protein n=1 Tax=Edaphobacter bradus TaxID=2259016 RepID=UPI0021E0B0C5|nr:DUF1223 domain-containing protein [Edaphobacter bradus]
MSSTQHHLASILLLALSALLPTASAQAASSTRVPVVVELFTSEGCSSCPPADALLGRLDREQPVNTADIIVLEEHVDYWDQGGWRDRFSSSQFTERQNNYLPRLRFEEPYTPQMVVDGSAQFVGSDGRKALYAISQAAQTPKITLTLANPIIEGRNISSSVSTASSGSLPKGDLYAAIVQSAASTNVGGGENGGRHLEHVGIVRSMQRIGKVQDLSSGPVKFTLSAPADAPAANLRVVVFAQSSGQGAIQGAATVKAGH